jgi:hypothetical protein
MRRLVSAICFPLSGKTYRSLRYLPL